MHTFLFVKLKMEFPSGIVNVDFDETMCAKKTAKWFVERAGSEYYGIVCLKDEKEMLDYLTSDITVNDGKLICPDGKTFIFDPVVESYKHNTITTIEMLRQYLLRGKTITKFYDDNAWSYQPSKHLYFLVDNNTYVMKHVFVNAAEMGYHFEYDNGKMDKWMNVNLFIYSP